MIAEAMTYNRNRTASNVRDGNETVTSDSLPRKNARPLSDDTNDSD